ncbi:hypothetical protein [Planctomicrobium sp. SH664]|uniref:hypothetical protein n=1 Tax=Planctomicrobium sp. SH664 TaxID=3448125 RepID=UPI003F5C10C4
MWATLALLTPIVEINQFNPMNQHHEHHGHHHSDHGHSSHPAPQGKGKSKLFILAIVLMLIGMVVYVMSMDEEVQPGGKIEEEMPAAAAP